MEFFMAIRSTSSNYTIQTMEQPKTYQKVLDQIRDSIKSKEYGNVDEARKQLSILIVNILKDESINDQQKPELIRNMLIELRNKCGGPSSPEFKKFLLCTNSTSMRNYFFDRCLMKHGYTDRDLSAMTTPYHHLDKIYFAEDLIPLKSKESLPFTCSKTLIVFNYVVNDGRGDFANGKNVVETYLKNCECHIEWRVIGDFQHLEKIRTLFKESIQKMVDAGYSLDIKWIDEEEVDRHVDELKNEDSRIVLAVSTGYGFFSFKSSVDSLHEMSPPIPDSSTYSENEYSANRLSLKLGFSPSSAGVLLPEETSYSLEEALAASGCLSMIQTQVGSEASLKKILENNDITIMYMKNDKNQAPQQRYLQFMGMYATHTGKPIHILVPTEDLNAFANFQKMAPSNVFLHHCPPLEPKYFEAIVQKATVAPGITGNDTLLHALVGRTPFFYDGRDCVKKIIPEFIDFCGEEPLDYATENYLILMEDMTRVWNPSEDMMQKVASVMHTKKEAIREDLERVHKRALEKNREAKNLLCNRLRERSERLTERFSGEI